MPYVLGKVRRYFVSHMSVLPILCAKGEIMRHSIMQDITEPRCYVTGTTYNLHWHHIYNGVGRRSMSEDQGFTVYLRADVHHALHNRLAPFHGLDYILKRECQRRYESTGHTRDEFIALVGKSYL